MVIFSLLAFIFTLVVYILGVSLSVFGGDSGDIILASYFGGVAHPPGYPLNTMIGWVFTHLPYSASVAYKANLMAAFIQAAVITVIFLIINKLVKNIPIALTASFLLAFNPLFWLYAHVIEVFQLNLLFVTASVLFLIFWRESCVGKQPNQLFLFISFLFLGLSFFHHQTAVLIVPAYFHVLWIQKKRIFQIKKTLIKLFLIFLLGFLPYIFIPFAAIRTTPINWDNPINLANFIRLITRADYGTFTATSQLGGVELKQRLISTVNYFLVLKADFTIIGIVLIILGAFYSYFKKRIYFWFTFLTIFFSGPFFLFYSSFPIINDFYFGLWERFVLLSYLFLAIYIGFGLVFVFELTNDFFKRFKQIRSYRHILILLIPLSFLLLPFAFLISNFYKTDLSEFHLGDYLGKDILGSSEDNAILFLLGDTAVFNTQYIYYTNGDNRNIKLIKGGSLGFPEYRIQVKNQYPELDYPSDFLSNERISSAKFIKGIISLNKKTYPIYAINFFPKIDGYRWITSGLLKKLTPEDSYSLDWLLEKNNNFYESYNLKNFERNHYVHFMESDILDYYYRALINLSDALIDQQEFDQAKKYLEKALYLFPKRKDAFIRFGNIYYEEKDCSGANEALQKVYEIDKKDWQALLGISNVYRDCFKNEFMAEQYREKADEIRTFYEKKGFLY